MRNTQHIATSYLLALLLSLAGCSVFGSDEGLPPCEFDKTPLLGKDTSLVVGAWDWVYSNQAQFGGDCVKYSVKTEGYTQSRTFYADGTVERYQDGILVQQGRYRFVYSGPDLSIHVGGPAAVFGVSADTLVLDFSPLDGPQEIYVRRTE